MTHPERRDQRRVPLDQGHTVSFTLEGLAFRDLPTPNLSGGGLCVMVPSDQARLFRRGALLEDLVLGHPGLPKDLLRGEVRYTLGGGHAEYLRFVGVGVQFLELPAPALQSLNEFVAGHFQEA